MKKNEKFNVVFLDIDGVLSPILAHTPRKDDHFPVDVSFSPVAVENLKTILKKSQAKLVISSRWLSRTNIQAVMLVLASHGITGPYVLPSDLSEKEVINQSDWFASNSYVFHGYSVTPKKMSSNKCEEINFWLNDYLDKISGFVVLDDDHQYGFDSYQVRTDPSVGLTEKDVEKSLEILNQGTKLHKSIRKKSRQEQDKITQTILSRKKETK